MQPSPCGWCFRAAMNLCTDTIRATGRLYKSHASLGSPLSGTAGGGDHRLWHTVRRSHRVAAIHMDCYQLVSTVDLRTAADVQSLAMDRVSATRRHDSTICHRWRTPDNGDLRQTIVLTRTTHDGTVSSRIGRTTNRHSAFATLRMAGARRFAVGPDQIGDTANHRTRTDIGSAFTGWLALWRFGPSPCAPART